MNSFTDFVAALDGREGSPSRESLDFVWGALRAALAHELRKRSLWNSPPSFLGAHGASTWWQPQSGGPQPRDALDELVAECYTQVFVLRLRSLRAHLKAKGNVDGLVFLAIRHFVHDRQKENDPEGYRVFDLVQQALRSLLDQGILSFAGAEPTDKSAALHNDTILTFRSQQAPPLATRDAFRALAPVWNNDLLPGIVTARYREKRRVQEQLEHLIAGLPAEGIHAFRLRDLVDPLKDDTRGRWRALAAGSQGEVAAGEGSADGPPEIVLQSAPDRHLEERDSFEKLTAAVAREISRRPELDDRTREYLRRLWRGLGRTAAGESLDGSDTSPDDSVPSQRALASALGIPRDRLPGLLGTLRRLTREVRAATGDPLPVKSSAKDGP